MDISDIIFSDETIWDTNSREALLFYANIGNKRVTCCISQEALNDFCSTDDTKEMALKNYDENKNIIQELATKLIEQDRFNERNEVFITSIDFK